MSQVKKADELEVIVKDSFENADDAIKVIVEKTTKKAFEEFKKKADKNKDGIVTIKETFDYGMELFNGNGLLMMFGIMISMVISAGFMLMRGIISIDTFVLILQIATPSTLVTYILKVIVGRLGSKTTLVMRHNKILQEENRQLDMALNLKMAHDKEYNK